jgi:hypothetical protein
MGNTKPTMSLYGPHGVEYSNVLYRYTKTKGEEQSWAYLYLHTCTGRYEYDSAQKVHMHIATTNAQRRHTQAHAKPRFSAKGETRARTCRHTGRSRDKPKNTKTGGKNKRNLTDRQTLTQTSTTRNSDKTPGEHPDRQRVFTDIHSYRERGGGKVGGR